MLRMSCARRWPRCSQLQLLRKATDSSGGASRRRPVWHKIERARRLVEQLFALARQGFQAAD